MNRLGLYANQLAHHLQITDNRTGKTIEVPISTSRESDFIHATKLGALKFNG